MSDNVSSVEKFRSNLIILIDIVSEMFEEGYENKVIKSDFKLMPILKIVIKKAPGDRMLKNFIKRSHPYWDQILNKDIDYFKNLGLELFGMVKDKGLEEYTKDADDGFLSKLSGNHVDLFKELMEGEYEMDGEKVSILDDERKEDIWKILHSFVKISVVYIHQGRKFQDGKYHVEFFPEIKVKENVSKWNIKSIKY
jgi:hypothetical protein